MSDILSLSPNQKLRHSLTNTHSQEEEIPDLLAKSTRFRLPGPPKFILLRLSGGCCQESVGSQGPRAPGEGPILPSVPPQSRYSESH